MTTQRPWYHKPEWIAVLVTAGASIVGGASAIAHNDAQTKQNTSDIQSLKQQSAGVPERLARIEQKVDDLRVIARRNSGSGD